MNGLSIQISVLFLAFCFFIASSVLTKRITDLETKVKQLTDANEPR